MPQGAGADISVCLLAYNHAGTIESTLQSVLAQTATGFEFLVSDDCSSDGTWERIVEFSRQHPGVTPLRTPANLGMAGNANYCVSRSRGRYIALLHHDDLYRPDLISKWAGVARRNPDVGFVFNRYAPDPGNYPLAKPLHAEAVRGEWFLRHILLASWASPVRGTALISRACWDRVGGMNCAFGMFADVDLWMRLSATAPVGFVPEEIIVVRHNRPEGYPDRYVRWSWLNLRTIIEIHATNWRAHFGYRGVAAGLRWFWFRSRVSMEIMKWLAYAVVKARGDMIGASLEARTPYEFFWVRWAGHVLRWLRRVGRA